MTVKRLLEEKGRQIWSVSPDTTVFDAARKMADHGIGALLVCVDDRLIGIFTERDYIRKVALRELSPHTTPVGEVMTERVLYVRPEQKVNECMALMTEKHVRHLPVIEGERVIGMVSIRDVIKDVIAEREFMIAQLENYITDNWA